MRFAEKTIAGRLRQHGYKLTPQRRAVIEAIASSYGCLTAGDIFRKVRHGYPDIGFVTVYRTLDVLTGLKLVCELHGGSGGRSYTISAPEHHHHLVCSSCGKVADISGYDLGDLEQRLSRETGFIIEGRLLEFTGLCRDCK